MRVKVNQLRRDCLILFDIHFLVEFYNSGVQGSNMFYELILTLPIPVLYRISDYPKLSYICILNVHIFDKNMQIFEWEFIQMFSTSQF